MPPRSIASIRRRSAALSRTTNCRFVPPFLIPPEQHRWSSGAKAKHHAVRGPAGQLARVVRRKRHEGAAHLVIEGPGGGRQLLPACHAEAAGTVPTAAATP